MEIDTFTLGKATTAPESMADRLAMCECKMIDTIAAVDSIGLAPGITSMSNDGFSVSTSNYGGKADVAGAMRAELATTANAYLAFPVNLLKHEVVVCCDHV